MDGWQYIYKLKKNKTVQYFLSDVSRRNKHLKLCTAKEGVCSVGLTQGLDCI